jgi:CHAT domain-containing protein/Tol biopolymer transport system component
MRNQNNKYQLILLILFLGIGPSISTAQADAKSAPSVVEMTQVTTHPDIDLTPRISPDGKWMAYVTRQAGNYDIWVRNTAGGRSNQITTHKADDFYPAWYPNSHKLAFVSQRSDAAGDIWTVKLREIEDRLFARGEPERFTDYMGFDGYPTVSPDGKKLLWVSDRTGRDELWFHNDNTGKTTQLTFLGGTHPCWSPALPFIAFTSFRAEEGNNGDIWMMHLNGPRPSTDEEVKYWDEREQPIYRVTTGPDMDGFPSWSSDAKKILFLRFHYDTNKDGVVSPADRGQTWIADVREAPQPVESSADPIQMLLSSSFNQRIVQYATPMSSGIENTMQPWIGADNRIYYSSDRGGNLDIWSFPADGDIPRLESAEAQYDFAETVYQLPQHLSREALGPVLLDWDGEKASHKDRQLLWDRILAFQRVIDFFGARSTKSAASMYNIGVCLGLLGFEDEANVYFQLLLDHYGQNRDILAYTEMARLGMQGWEKSGDEKYTFLAFGLNEIIDRYSDLSEPAALGQITVGELHFLLGQDGLAFEAYSRVLKNYPQERDVCAESQLKIGDVFTQIATKEEVVNAYLAVVRDYPEQRQWMIPARNRILELLSQGAQSDAALIGRYREIVGQYSEFPLLAAAAQLRIGEMLAKSRNYAAAQTEYELVEKLFPQLVDEAFTAQMGRAMCLLQTGESLRAFALLEEMAKTYEPTRPLLAGKVKSELLKALVSSGNELKKNQDFELAITRYKQAIGKDFRNVDAHRGYIECMYYLGRINQAIEEYEKLYRQHTDDNIITYSIGLAYSYKGTEKAELYGDPEGLNPDALNNSNNLIARALSFDYTFVQAYLTLSYNYEMLENYQASQAAKPKKFYRKIFDTVTAPVVYVWRKLTFYQERTPPRYYERAIHELTKAIGLNDEATDPLLEANLALNLANNYYNLGEFGYEKAYQYYQIKLKYDSTFVDKERETLIYTRIGHCALVAKDLDRGPGYLLRAIKLQKAAGNENGVLINTKRLALLKEIGDENDEAIDYYLAASEIEKKNNYFSDLMRSYRSVAYNYWLLGEPEDAIQYAKMALELLDSGKVKGYKEGAHRIKIGFFGLYVPMPFYNLATMGSASAVGFSTSDERAFVYTILGQSYNEEKDYGQAISYFQQKLAIFKKRKDYQATATLLNNLGYFYAVKGEYENALENFLASLEICEKRSFLVGRIRNALNISQIVLILNGLKKGEQRIYDLDSQTLVEKYYPLAMEKVQQALEAVGETKINARDRCFLHIRLAELSLARPGKHGSTPFESAVYSTLSLLDNAVLAEGHVNEALDLSKRYKLSQEGCAALYVKATAAVATGDVETAYVTFLECRKIALRQAYYDYLWRVDNDLGQLIAAMTPTAKRTLVVQRDALEYFIEAINILEAHPTKYEGAVGAQLRRQHETPYKKAIHYLVEKGDVRGSLDFAERMRSKLFLDLMGNQRIELRKERHKLLFNNARYVQREIDELEINLLRAKFQLSISAMQIADWKDELARYKKEYDGLLEKIRNEIPELESLVRVTAASLEDIQRILRPNDVVLYFTVLDDYTAAWIISQAGLEFSKVALTDDEIDGISNSVASALAQNDAGGVVSAATAFLGLLGKTDITPQNVIVIPDQSLFAWPWSVLLRLSSQEESRTACAVSSSLTSYYYAFQMRKLSGKRIYLANKTELEDSLKKAGYQIISPVSGAQGNSFQMQASSFARSDVIHLPATAVWNAADPAISKMGFRVQRSALALFEPVTIYQYSISANALSLNLDTPIPSLSALEVYLTVERAFSYAGISAVVLPVYKTASTGAHFFAAFYARLDSLPVARALEETQRALKNENLPLNEYAAFQVFGFGGMSETEARQYAETGFETIVRRGHSAFDLGEWSDAIFYYEQAFNMAERRNDSASMDLLVQRIMESAVNGGLWEKAIEWQQNMIKRAESAGDVAGVANGYSNLAYFYTQNNQYELGVEYKKKYSQLAERYGLHEEEAKSFRETGLIFERGGQYDKAKEFYQTAMAKFAAVGSLIGQAQCLRDLGRLYFTYFDDYADALRYQGRARDMFASLGDSTELFDASQNLGLTEEKIGNYQNALSYQQTALRIAQKSADQRMLGMSHQNLANIYWKMGDWGRAMEHQNQATGLFQDIGDTKLLQIAHSTTGLIYLSFGQDQRALDEEFAALDLAVQNDDQKDQATIFKNISTIYRATGRTDLALSNIQQATLIDSTIASKRGLAYDYRNLAAIRLQTGELHQAENDVRQAVVLSESINDARNLVQSLLILGDIDMRGGRLDSAKVHSRRAAELAGSLFMPDLQWRGLKNLAEIAYRQHDLDGAEQHFFQALDVIEQLRAKIKVEEYASGFIDDKMNVYDALIALLFERKKYQDALAVAERAKGRSFLDMLGNRHIRFSGVDSTLVTLGESLKIEINVKETEFRSMVGKDDAGQEEKRIALQEELRQLKSRYSDYLNRLKISDPEVFSIHTVEPVAIAEVQQLLPAGAALIEYHPTASRIFMWLVTADRLEAASVDVAWTGVASQIDNVRKSLEKQLSFDASAGMLYQWLIKPFESELAGVGHIIFVPQGLLHYLPFAILRNDAGQYLGWSYTTSITPSASVLSYSMQKGQDFLNQNPRQLAVLGLGNPDLGDRKFDLPFAEREVKSLDRYFDHVMVRTGNEASESFLQQQTEFPPLMLFSCHGEYDDANPLFSAILLAPDEKNDGRLEANEIFGYHFHAHTVALSACETGVGKIRGGDEVVGLSRSFVYAGAASLVTSLWKVDDLATAVLVKRFFRNLAEGKPRAEALQEAEKVVHDEINPYPSYWAGFTITGDFR